MRIVSMAQFKHRPELPRRFHHAGQQPRRQETVPPVAGSVYFQRPVVQSTTAATR
jgi:hypothetical protein